MAKIVIIACCILIVAIPEGLPLAISIAMALSINKLKNDEILIKNVNAVQTAAMIHDICVGKSGTITTGVLHVAKYQLFDNYTPYDNNWENEGDKFSKVIDIQSELKNLIIESIASNTDVRVEMNDETMTFEPMGDSLEVGMMQFLVENDEDINKLLIQRNRHQTRKC
jgi:P-type E1-E2 ATPase